MRVLLIIGFLTANVAFTQSINDTTFVKLTDYTSDVILDMRYATEDNFLKSKVYECGDCYLRMKTVKQLISASKAFKDKGFTIKIYDCYRPIDVQKKMWGIVPNPIYVADPAKGSIHNRGGAVDITLVDGKGFELDMGTQFDHFGPESAHGYKDICKDVRKNRRFLRRTMEKHGFKTFESEWWHYNLENASKLPLSNFKWICD